MIVSVVGTMVVKHVVVIIKWLQKTYKIMKHVKLSVFCI